MALSLRVSLMSFCECKVYVLIWLCSLISLLIASQISDIAVVYYLLNLKGILLPTTVCLERRKGWGGYVWSLLYTWGGKGGRIKLVSWKKLYKKSLKEQTFKLIFKKSLILTYPKCILVGFITFPHRYNTYRSKTPGLRPKITLGKGSLILVGLRSLHFNNPSSCWID